MKFLEGGHFLFRDALGFFGILPPRLRGLDRSVSLETHIFHRVETVGSDHFGHRFDVDDTGDIRRGDEREMTPPAVMLSGARDTFAEEEYDADGHEDRQRSAEEDDRAAHRILGGNGPYVIHRIDDDFGAAGRPRRRPQWCHYVRLYLRSRLCSFCNDKQVQCKCHISKLTFL